jgi:hypothetical protein
VQLLDIRVKRDQREANHDADHEPADVLWNFWLRIHAKLFDVDPADANELHGNRKAAMASMTR